MTKHFVRIFSCLACLACLTLAGHVAASPDAPPDYDFDWATITDPGNPAYAGGPQGELAGRGSVSYTYRISRLELTSNQFLEFVNTFWKSAGIPMPTWFIGSSGIQSDLQGPYALKPNLPNAGMVPVIGLSWRVSAMYCNWLTNGKSSDPASLQYGAYDVSTFHTNPDGTFTDQLTHSPNAKFWIPTLDEWMKAAHYDPDRYGKGQGGWWESPNGTDVPLVNGPPGIGQTSGAGTYDWQYPPSDIPLGSYSDVQSPWGLWDVSGGAAEWTEEAVDSFALVGRIAGGSWAGSNDAYAILDTVYQDSWWTPASDYHTGLRIASAAPSPGCLAVFATILFAQPRRRKK